MPGSRRGETMTLVAGSTVGRAAIGARAVPGRAPRLSRQRSRSWRAALVLVLDRMYLRCRRLHADGAVVVTAADGTPAQLSQPGRHSGATPFSPATSRPFICRPC